MIVGIARIASQKELDKGLKIKSNYLVDVVWLDACSHMNVEKINLNKLRELLCPTHTMGRVVAQDKEVLCVATNISAANGLDLIAIPIKWIKTVNVMTAE